jgi:tRNASer (uridine44-2'-O)-methyltransferase
MVLTCGGGVRGEGNYISFPGRVIVRTFLSHHHDGPITCYQKMQPPRFEPKTCPSSFVSLASGFIPLLFCTAEVPPEVAQIAYEQLINHPEYNSTLILRSETLHEYDGVIEPFPDGVPYLQDAGLQLTKCIHRKILPRRPGRDASMEQFCSLYAPAPTCSTSDCGELGPISTMILTPIIPEDGLPYYHPRVSHIAFRFNIDTSSLSVEVDPLPDTSVEPGSKLYRTAQSLLETLHRYFYGFANSYRKKMIHDVIVPRNEYQDLYLVMRERWKSYVQDWKEVTDPAKHVFEDVGIATWLMLFWRETFKYNFVNTQDDDDGDKPWKSWPRPPGGFVDLG